MPTLPKFLKLNIAKIHSPFAPANEICLASRSFLAQSCPVISAKTCAVVIPCFNEAETIGTLVTEVRQYLPLVIVVDDGSTDSSANRADATGAAVIKHPRNLGKGAALRTGLSLALKEGFAWAFTLDGDGQHAPEDLPAFLHCAGQTGARLIIGNRMHNARAIPWLRRQVNWWMSRRLSRLSDQYLPDTQCGFRLVHLKTWATLPLKTQRFEVESETLMAFLAAGQRVEFVPIEVIGRGRHSHIQPLADTVRWWKWWRNFNWSAESIARREHCSHWLICLDSRRIFRSDQCNRIFPGI